MEGTGGGMGTGGGRAAEMSEVGNLAFTPDEGRSSAGLDKSFYFNRAEFLL